MLPIKIDLTKELATKLRQLRLENPVNGEILTAENLSKAIGNNRAWMSQIESRRLKKIKREDIIAIYKLLYSISSTEEAEEKAELDLIDYLINKSKFQSKKIISTKGNDNNNEYSKYCFEKPSLDNIDSLYKEKCKDISNFFLGIYKNASTQTEKEYLYQLISKLSRILTECDIQTLKLISEIDFHLFQYVPDDEKEDVIDLASNFAFSLEKYYYQTFINLYHEDLAFIKKNIDTQLILHPYSLVPIYNYSFNILTDLVYNDKYPFSLTEKITFINEFIPLLNKAAIKYHIDVSIELIKPSSNNNIIDETMRLIQSFINSLPSNPAYFMNQPSDYTLS